MGLLDKKSVKLDAVQDFSWSPADAIMCALAARPHTFASRGCLGPAAPIRVLLGHLV